MIWIPVILVALFCAALVYDAIRWARERQAEEREIQALRKQGRIARRWGR